MLSEALELSPPLKPEQEARFVPPSSRRSTTPNTSTNTPSALSSLNQHPESDTSSDERSSTCTTHHHHKPSTKTSTPTPTSCFAIPASVPPSPSPTISPLREPASAGAASRSPFSLGSPHTGQPPAKRLRSSTSTASTITPASPVSTAVEWSADNAQSYYRLKKFLPTNVHPRLRLGASKNVGVGRVRLQAKGLGNSTAMSTIKTFGVEEVEAIIMHAAGWAQSQPDCPDDLGSIGELLTALARMPLQEFSPTPLFLHRLTLPQVSGDEHPLLDSRSQDQSQIDPADSDQTNRDKRLDDLIDHRVQVFCDRLAEFLRKELRTLL